MAKKTPAAISKMADRQIPGIGNFQFAEIGNIDGDDRAE